MSELTVTRWTKYGHDRLYVQTADGTRLGHWDNKTGTVVLADGADRAAFDAALASYRAGGGQAAAAPGPAAAAAPSAPPQGPPFVETVGPPAGMAPEQPASPTTWPLGDPGTMAAPAVVEWRDLAQTKAGAAAREQALVLKQAAPVRTFLARALGVKTDERAWRIGADGEEAVAARLRKLGDRWKVLHAVPVGENGSDIDHVVIGPGGVFTINTKHHPDASVWVGGNTFMVDGQRVPYVRNSRFEARRTAKLLGVALGLPPVPATALIAVMGANKGFTVKAQPAEGDVVVVTRREVGQWLARRPEVLPEHEVEQLYAVARRSDTWR